MKPATMLKRMYTDTLTAADRRAIRKSRGFASHEVSSLMRFEIMFLSEKGLAGALTDLSDEEIAVLHLLRHRRRPVGLRFFKYIYGGKAVESSDWSWGTYTQRYRPIFKLVRQRLVRRGLLLYAEKKKTDQRSKLERSLFMLPEAFGAHLPSPVRSPKRYHGSGSTRTKLMREKLRSVLAEGGSTPFFEGEKYGYDPVLKHGQLNLGTKPFTVERVREWQLASWKRTGFPGRNMHEKRHGVAIVEYLLSHLKAVEWLNPDELDAYWSVLYPRTDRPESERVCEAGYRWGYLSRYRSKGTAYYRLAPASAWDERPPEEYMRILASGAVDLDLDTIPLAAIETFAQLATFSPAADRLRAHPDLITIGTAPVEIHSHPLVEWLVANVPQLSEILDTVAERRGKHILHTNLLIAKVDDLELKVKIERALKNRKWFIRLPEHYLAFPSALRDDIETIVRRAGHVVKIISD